MKIKSIAIEFVKVLEVGSVSGEVNTIAGEVMVLQNIKHIGQRWFVDKHAL